MYPTNRHLLIEIQKQEPAEERQTTFLLPEDYKKKTDERYTAVKILEVSGDSEKFHQYHRGKTCVVETSMINEIKLKGNTYNIVGENYVVLISEV
tara:strand:- start:831 stop:1115 length:285 start_codon:yes stop_codon:yes gene_type:complete